MKRSITSAAMSMRPAALIRGAIRNATSSEVSGRPSRRDSSSNAFSPGFTAVRSAFNPRLAMTRFSPCKGTESAMVAMAAIFRNESSSGVWSRCGSRLASQSLRQFKSNPGAAKRFAGIIASRLIGINHGIGMRQTIRSRKVMVGNNEVNAGSPRALRRSKSAGAGIDADNQPNTGSGSAFDYIPA